ncbi:erythroid differentiation-related factor 1 isoform X2 [Pristis pectinata]|uniref:erythroid differentiation-related factor 1 isoform X2 n=1 Tax=Pristis pectinata TaxID=685728 RepID=UPI00223DD87C|nr:erythroid differentiation-related factor 1 isoform X2 [Pristis pectinata]
MEAREPRECAAAAGGSPPRTATDHRDSGREDGDFKQESIVGGNEVKSTAVVKYSAVPPPAAYARLQEKTDLKLPPANWLRGISQLGQTGATSLGTSKKSKPFSSFGMAYDFIDCIGNDVDVVSDSENIKKLLKIPYSKSHVSMGVHRIGRTLLLDELDIQELFVTSSQTGDWNWLKELYQRLVDPKWQRKKKSREHFYQKAILSKFLYYSINGDCAAEAVPTPIAQPTDTQSQENQIEVEESSWPAPLRAPASVPEDENPQEQGNVPLGATYVLEQVASTPKEQNLTTFLNEGENSQGLKNDFVRNILWTFEDIHMLVGSNMPIFGGGKYPAVSLRLRDSNKPINILTGIDYWLDNLMCNVPELVMCFHVNGIVQRYEMIKTEDIPNLDNSSFSTKVVKDIAQNILSFLKANCTKEGHTYWLFKASGSDIVKLYDLTTLCEETTEDKYQNPFTMPVAVLLYKVASNMMMKKVQNRKHYGIIRMLLLNCIKLLDKEKHPQFVQIIASANYMISELFQLNEPPKQDENGSTLNENSDDSYSEDEDLPEDSDDNGSFSNGSDPSDDSKAVAVIRSVGELSVPEKYKSTHQIRPSCAFPVCHDMEERCRVVLNYVLEGLKAVDGSIKKESDLPAADPSIPIPLKYADESECTGHKALKKQIALFLDKVGPVHDTVNLPSQSGMIPNTWQYQMKLNLIFKASRAYFILSEAATALQKYGRALRYIKLALQSLDAYCCLINNLSPEVLFFLSQCLTLNGDIQLMLAQNASNRAAYQEEYSYQSREDQEILHSLYRESSCQAFSWATELYMDLEYQLSVSCKCYEAANELLHSCDQKVHVVEQHTQVLKRLGNSRNEVGVFYMNQAAAIQTEGTASKGITALEQELWKKSFSYFEKGIQDFETIEDATNTALLLCNTGRLMRLCAQAHATTGSNMKRGEFSPEEALYYNKAVDYYLRAMRSLTKWEKHPAVWDSVKWELSTTYFTMATLEQDYAPLSRKAQEQIEREVTDFMMKSLKYCDIHTESARQPLCQYRAATIHHRLASMYHNSLRNQVGDDHFRKQYRSLADLHYNKAVKLFQLLKDAPCELLRVQLERVAFSEFQMTNQNSNASKLKTLSGALDIIINSEYPFQLIQSELSCDQARQGGCHENQEGNASENDSSSLNEEEILKLVNMFETRLSFLLFQLIKLLTSKRKSSGTIDDQITLKNYKHAYSTLLRATADKDTTLLQRVEMILSLLKQLSSR